MTAPRVDSAGSYPGDWRVTWASSERSGPGAGAAMFSVGCATAAEARVAALGVVETARRGEVRISANSEEGSPLEIFTSRYELEVWRPDQELLPRSVDSLWQTEVRGRASALRFYCRLRDILTEAAQTGVIRRGDGRELRARIRAVLLDD